MHRPEAGDTMKEDRDSGSSICEDLMAFRNDTPRVDRDGLRCAHRRRAGTELGFGGEPLRLIPARRTVTHRDGEQCAVRRPADTVTLGRDSGCPTCEDLVGVQNDSTMAKRVAAGRERPARHTLRMNGDSG